MVTPLKYEGLKYSKTKNKEPNFSLKRRIFFQFKQYTKTRLLFPCSCHPGLYQAPRKAGNKRWVHVHEEGEKKEVKSITRSLEKSYK